MRRRVVRGAPKVYVGERWLLRKCDTQWYTKSSSKPNLNTAMKPWNLKHKNIFAYLRTVNEFSYGIVSSLFIPFTLLHISIYSFFSCFTPLYAFSFVFRLFLSLFFFPLRHNFLHSPFCSSFPTVFIISRYLLCPGNEHPLSFPCISHKTIKFLYYVVYRNRDMETEDFQ